MIKLNLLTTKLIDNSLQVHININNHEKIVDFPISQLSDSNERKLLEILNNHIQESMGLEDLGSFLKQL